MSLHMWFFTPVRRQKVKVLQQMYKGHLLMTNYTYIYIYIYLLIYLL
jgi:hypothetical protein